MFSSLLRRRDLTSGRLKAGRTHRQPLRTRRVNRKPWLELLEDRTLLSAWVTTDKSDYAPGETVLITGGEFSALETVNLQVLHTDGRPNTGDAYQPWRVVSDVTGGFHATWVVPDDARGSSFQLTALGLSSDEAAQTTFTDAAHATIEAWKTTGTPGWQSSTLNPGSHSYSEGDDIPFRYVFANLTPGSVWSITIQYDFANGSKHFFDSLGTYNQTETTVTPTAGHTVTGGPNTFTIPTDPSLPPGAQILGNFTVYNGTITTAGPLYSTVTSGGSTLKQLVLTGTVDVGGGTKDVLVLFGGHLARENEWGPLNGAASFPGASAKMYFVNYVGSTGSDSGDNLSINPGGIVKKADLALTKADSPDPVVVGNTLTYTLTVSNNGPNQATAATVTDTLPAGTTFVSATSASFTCTNSGSTVTCTLNSGTPINAGASATITIVVQVGAGAADPITNTATVSAVTPTDPNTANNTATATTAVLPALSVNDVSQLEGNTGTTAFTFTVTRSGPTNRTATVSYTTADGTALVADSDYQATSGTLTFNPGEATKIITVLVNGDTKFEPDETFFVNLSGATNAGIGDGQGQGTIRNDDGPPAITINDVSQVEGNAGTTPFTFTVSLSNASTQAVTVQYATANGTATAPGDYTGTSGTLTFAPGTTSQTVTVLVNGDMTAEPDETFFVNLSGPTNATIADNQGVGTIVNDDGQPSISINDVSANEGNSGTTGFTFTVSLSNPSSQTVTVAYATADGTATVADSDYIAASGTVTFAPGQTSQSVTVNVVGDTKFETNETFFVNLSGATGGAAIGDSQGQGTIVNDDGQPALAINDVSANEGNGGTTFFTFTVTLTNASSQPVTVNYVTADGTATTADGDYVAAAGTLTFAPGQVTQTVTVSVNGDTKFEPNETFFVNLSGASGATIAAGQGQGTIVNDDTRPSISINDISQPEGNAGTTAFTFTVSLSKASTETVTVNYSTADGTATAPGDYAPAGGTVTFAPGATSQTVTVLVNGDTTFEPDETFFVNLSAPTNATLADSQGVGTIQNDDATPAISISDETANEGNAGPTTFTFTFSLSNPSSQIVTVQYATADGTATAPGDYAATSGTVTFAPGITSQTVTVLVNGDTVFEPDETFFVNLSGPANATIADNQGVGTIVNDDGQPSITINDVSANEGNSGTTPFTFTVTLSNASYQTVTVQYATADDTATTADADYVAAGGTVTFLPGQTSQTVTVLVNGDSKFEPTETFFVNLSAATNATIADSQGVGTIVNDDAPPTISIGDASGSEGNTGTTPFSFSVTLSNASYQTVTVAYATADGTATTADADYVATGGVVTFAPGQTSQTVMVNVVGDKKVEPDETFLVNLSLPANATITDGQGLGTIQNDDHAPVAQDDAYSTNEDTPLTVPPPGVLANDSDADGDPMTAVLVSGPTHAAAFTLNPDGSFSYTPAANYNGTDQFTYQASDGPNSSNAATVTLTVNAVNDAPVAVPDSYTTQEDTALTVPAPGVLGNDTDVEGDALTAVLVSGPSHGTLTLNTDGSFTYTPASNYNGTDSFTYKANDGQADSNVTTVSLTVTPVNDAPVALNDAYSTNEDTTLTVAAPGVLANDTDVDGDSLSAVLVSGPAHGTLTLSTDGSFSYTPAANYNGPDSFTYKANDGQADSNVAVVSLTVTAVNDAPVANDDAYSTNEDGTLLVSAPGVLANDTDVDGDTLTAVLVSGPAHGVLVLSPDGSLSYTPDPNYNGPDSFTYRASDGQAFSNVATVTLTVTAVNDPPVAVDDAYTTPEDTPLVVPAPGVLANDTDVDGDPLTAILVSGPSHGTLTWGGGSTGQFTDTTVSDFSAGSPGGSRVVMHVGDGEVTLTPTVGEEFSGSSLPAGWSGAPWSAGGTVTVAGGQLTVDGARAATDTNYSAGRSLEYVATFGAGTFQHVGFVGDFDFNAPWAIFSTFNTSTDLYARTNDGATQIDTLIPGSWLGTAHLFRIDWDAAAVNYFIDGNLVATHVTAIASTMRPIVSDFSPGGAALSVDWLQMTPHNTAATFQSRVFDAGTSASWDSAAWTSDTPPGTALTFSVRTGDTPTPDGSWTAYTPLAGSGASISQTARYLEYRADLATSDPNQTPVLRDVTVNFSSGGAGDGSFTYTPDPNFNGLDSFTYQANDGQADSNVATVWITVTPVNDAPVAVNDAYATQQATPLVVAPPGVLGNDSDVDGDPLTSVLVSGPAHGTLVLSPAGAFTYTPDAAFSGTDSFTYRASDGQALSNLATVTITVTAVNISISDVTQAEGNSGTTAFTFTVTLSSPSTQTVTVDYATADGTAMTPSDYVPAAGTVVFLPGETSQTITVLVNGDITFEPDETFFVNLSNASKGTIVDNQGLGTIVNDDSQPTISISDVMASEGDAGTTPFVFTVTLSNPSFETVTVTYATADGTATTADGDYVAASGTLTFAPGQVSQTVTVSVNGDTKFEPDETFFVNLSSPTNATIADGQGVGTILNDDAPPTITIDDVIQAEGNAGTTPFTFTVTLSNPSYQTVTVQYSSADGTAMTADSDYLAAGGTVTFAPGQTSQMITVNVVGDTKFEPTEDFLVNLSGAVNATIAKPTGTGTIVNDDTQPTISINDVAQAEGNSGTTAFTFTVTLSNASSQTVTVQYATSDGTALTADSDYQGASGTVTFNPGEMSKTITVLVNGDTKFELDETFFVDLLAPTNATVADPQGQGTIVNDDTPPTISINDIAQAEGNAGTTPFTFTVTLSNASYQVVTVDFATADGTALVADADYDPEAGVLTFAPGTTSQTVTVLVNGDTKFEPNETFFVNLSMPSNASIADGQGLGTIVNDDAQPTISTGDAMQNEGDAGTTPFVFTVTLSNPSFQTVTVQYSTANGTATTADGDYVAASGTVTFLPGQVTQTITVNVTGDTKFEPDETFYVNLSSPTNATIADGQGAGTILNDDAPPTITIDDVIQAEGNAGTTPFTFTVTLSNPSYQTVTVQYSTADGTATTADSDYVAAGGTVTFAPGTTSQTVTVNVVGDTKFEPTEDFLVNLSGAVNATIAKPTGTGTIVNDDTQPSISISDVSQPEGNSGTTAFVFTVSLSNASSQTVTVQYATSDGTAMTADNDYVFAIGTVTFAPGTTSQTVTVSVVGDTKFELDETFFVDLLAPTNATVADPQGQGTILNDDTPPSISINDVSKPEGNAGPTPFTFTVTLSNASYQPITVNYATADGTALVSDADYDPETGVLTFAPGTTAQTVTVLVNGDTKFEPNETFSVNLSLPTNATVSDGQGLGTIQNDDTQPTISIGDATQNEGDAGTTPFVFTVTLSNPTFQTVTVTYSTANGTATTADNDYQGTSGTVTFAPGQVTQTVTISVNGDTKFEPNETFYVNLSAPTNATIADGQGLGTIVNDDAPPTITINDVAANEGNSGTTPFTFTVTLSNPSYQTVTVQYSTADGTATAADNDYVAASGTVTFAPGTTTQTVTVNVVGDTKFELDETFLLNLSNPSNATILVGTGTGTILNDDTQPSISISDRTANEGDAGTTPFVFTVTLSNPTFQTVTVNYATANGTATTADGDYVAASGTVTFLPGQVSQTVTVSVNGDTKFEPDETFFVNLSSPTNATIADGQGVGTIVNDDAQPTVIINDVAKAEGNSGTTPFTFTVSLTNPSYQTVTVSYATADGTATTADNDYLAASGTVTFAPGTTSQTLTVSVVGDKKVEADETFFVNLTGATNATLPPGSKGTGTIVNDDNAPVAVPDSYSTNEDTTLSVPPPGVLANDTDADGDALTAELVTGPMHGTLTLNANGSFTYTPVANYNGPDQFVYQASDGANSSAPATVTLTVVPVNDAPVVTTITITPEPSKEGELVHLVATFTDPDLADTHTATINWGNGTTTTGTVTPNGNGTFTVTGDYAYPDDGPSPGNGTPQDTYTVIVTVTDAAGATGSKSKAHVVQNVAPTIQTVTCPDAPVPAGIPLTVSGTFTDPGVLDVHTAVWNWGDGTTSAGTVVEAGGSGTVTGTHTYAAEGVYTLTLTVYDDDGGSDTHTCQTFVVVFGLDTKVTGGGWINSPPGAEPARPTATGKANFGFNAKYHVGDTTPTGETNFRFVPGNLHFHSTSYDNLSLIVTTLSPGVQRAEWKGSGWINGSGDYAFKAMVIDAGEPGSSDKFRIRIWNKITQAVIYDNEPLAPDATSPQTLLGGGNIQIHNFLHAAGDAAAGAADAAALTQEALAPIVTEAIAFWDAAGVDGPALSALRTFEVRIADLPDSLLGVTTPGVIWIDQNAAGHGWRIDATPIVGTAGNDLSLGRMDLFTVVAHEMGHALGLSHSADPNSVMYESLAPGAARHGLGCGCPACAGPSSFSAGPAGTHPPGCGCPACAGAKPVQGALMAGDLWNVATAPRPSAWAPTGGNAWLMGDDRATLRTGGASRRQLGDDEILISGLGPDLLTSRAGRDLLLGSNTWTGRPEESEAPVGNDGAQEDWGTASLLDPEGRTVTDDLVTPSVIGRADIDRFFAAWSGELTDWSFEGVR